MQVLPEGQYIKHEQYGYGVVTEADVERTTIDFDSHGKKKFVTSLMRAELVGEAPPKAARPRRRKKVSVEAAVAKANAAATAVVKTAAGRR
ncbi:MAG: hypothetical protein HY237_01160 [Acidobacteria bacterium]|nr:hypothetical protein [Acidobacteriota bacterium]